MNYLIHHSDWSATCHSKPLRSSHIYIQQGGWIKRLSWTNSSYVSWYWIVIAPLFRIIRDQIMEVEAMNFTAWYLAQKLVCLEDTEGGKFDVVCASAETVTDEQFLQSLKNTTEKQFSGLWVEYSWNMNRHCRPTANQCKKQSLLSQSSSEIWLRQFWIFLFSSTVWIYFRKL